MNDSKHNQGWNKKIEWYRPQIDRKTLKQLTKRSDLRGILQMGGLLLISLLTASAVLFSWYHAPWYITLCALFVHGTFFSFLGRGVAGHELSHYTVFKTRALNQFCAHLFGFLSHNNFHTFREAHTKHHRFTTYKGLDLEVVQPQTFRNRDWLYFLTFNIPGMLTSYRTLIRHSAGRLEGELELRLFSEDAALRRKIFNQSRAILVGHVALASLFIWQAWWPMLLLVTFPFYGLWLAMLCGYTQHMGLPSDVSDFRLCCRTVLLNPFLSFLYCQMNYHIEHHMCPGVPFYNLARLRKEIQGDLPQADKGLVQCWKQIVRTRKKQRTDPTYAHMQKLPE